MTQTATLSLAGEERYLDDARWVAHARAGDGDAVLRLLARYRPLLVRSLAGMTGDAATAEDLAQETFLQAFRRLGQLRDPARFYPWVRRMGVRHTLKWLRRQRETAGEPQPAAEDSADPRRTVESRLAIEAVLRRLPPDLRATLVLREIDGLDYREIAAELMIPVGTVRSRLFNARERFRAAWLEMER